MSLEHCRTTQEEWEHVHNWGMYAMDVACARGKTFDVYAPTWKNKYVVRKVWYDKRLWNHIILKHGEFWFVFAHVETLLKEGDRVKPWQEIGMVDKSGISENYHLHFELWKHDYNISYKAMLWEETLYNTEKTYKLRKQRGWYVWEKEAMDFIAEMEGFSPVPYEDGVNGRMSIWYWTASFKGEKAITKEEAKQRKMHIIEELMEKVYKENVVPYHNQRQALVSMMYNLWKNSSIKKVTLRKTKSWQIRWIMQYTKGWNKHKGKKTVLWGLIKRRTKEANLYTWIIKL